MSTIKFAPDPSGTAQFTIAAPATNTNRTITLPDETATLIGAKAATNLAVALAIVLG